MFNVKDFLSNSKMGRLVAHLLGRTDLEVGDNGTVVLTDAERELIRSNFGDAFLSKLEGMKFSDANAESSHELYDAAVAFRVQQAEAPLRRQIQTLQTSINQLADEPEPSPTATPVGSSAVPQLFQVNMAARHNALASQLLSSTQPMTFAALETTTIDVADLNSEFSIVMPPKVRLELLTKRLYLGFADAKHLKRIQSNTDYIASAALITEVSQEFTPKWTPKGQVKFTPIRIPYRRHKLNVPIRPTEILKSWLLYLYEQGKTMQEMPLTRYIIEEHIIPKAQDDITRSMLGKGKYEAAPTSVRTGDAGRSASKSMDGYETILVEGKKSGKYKIKYFKDAKDPFKLKGKELLDYVNAFANAISQYFVGSLPIYCSPQFLAHYQNEDFAVNGKYTGLSIGNKIRFTSFEFIPMESMYNSPILFATPESNFVMLVDYSKADQCINKIEEVDYEVKVFGEYSLSVGFQIGEGVFAAVPDGYDPSAAIILDSPEVGSDESDWTYGGPSEQEEEEELHEGA